MSSLGLFAGLPDYRRRTEAAICGKVAMIQLEHVSQIHLHLWQ